MTSKRDKELARMRAQRQAARMAAAAARRRHRNNVLALAVVLLLVLGAVFAFVANRDDSTTTAQSPDKALCTWNKTADPASRPVTEPSTTPAVFPTSATMVTNRGTIAFTLNPDAPCAATSIASLASQGFYDNTPCHRLTTAGLFVLQCGDPTGTGTGGPGYQFQEEALTGATYDRGIVAMAKGTPAGTTSSQFFIVYKNATSPLPPLYTPIGKVTRGLDVVDKVALAGSVTDPKTGNTAPKLPISITTLRTTDAASTTPTAPASATPTIPGDS